MPIHPLPPELISQIAAGEVVERPASVVKELVENSLDAGASTVVVTVRGAGKQLIEVTDNGHGIPAGELTLAVARHATSKLATADDLFRIHTLGFRGEALASIASVSRFTITSRTAEAETGARLRIEGGRAVGEIEPVGAPVGTTVRVEDLFYNVPARRKFLKSDTTEKRRIDALLTRYALAYPTVRFRLVQDGKPALQTAGNGERREVLAALYGPETARRMLEVDDQNGHLHIHGFISPPDITKSHRREIIFFVNGRPVQDSTLVAALLKAYHTLLMVGRYPLAVLFIDMPPEEVDVNVHPTKAEVRFRQPDAVFRAVRHAVRRTLLAYTPIPDLELPPAPEPRPAWLGGGEARAFPWEATPPTVSAGNSLHPPAEHPPLGPDAFPEAASQASPEPQQPTLPGSRLPLLRPIGQIAATYIVAEGPDGLYLIDQHAAHERVLFEKFMAQRQEGIPAQALLEPVTVHLLPQQARLLEEQLPYLGRWGFQVEPFGPNTFRVRAVPALLAKTDPAEALRALVEDFEEDETPLKDEIEARIIARVCKRVAVKGGQRLSPQAQEALIRDLEACQNPRSCPHGRPTMIHISVDTLEKQFGRLGPK